jgi:hypothetical protein
MKLLPRRLRVMPGAFAFGIAKARSLGAGYAIGHFVPMGAQLLTVAATETVIATTLPFRCLIPCDASWAIPGGFVVFRSPSYRPHTNVTEAVPLQAIPAILDLFKTYQVVGLGEGPHGNVEGMAFRLKLIRDPRFPTSSTTSSSSPEPRAIRT